MRTQERLARVAKETLDIFRDGWYINTQGTVVTCKSENETFLLTEDALNAATLRLPQSWCRRLNIEVRCESVVDTIVSCPDCAVLNFASATKPGGGFLEGAQAQEEALARSSDLYLGQIAYLDGYYVKNKQEDSLGLYTHSMLYHKDVTVIRRGDLTLLPDIIRCSVLTAPAPNARLYLQLSNDLALLRHTLQRRIEYVLRTFAMFKCSCVVLGAYGCGVFGNDTETVATLFRNELKHYVKYFDRVIFSITDAAMYDTFAQTFKV